MWPAILTFVGTLLVTFVARIPALTAEGRARASIKADLELWASLPIGPAKEMLRGSFEHDALELLVARDERRQRAGSSRSLLLIGVLTVLGLSVVAVVLNFRDRFANLAEFTPVLAAILGAVVGLVNSMLLARRQSAQSKALRRKDVAAYVRAWLDDAEQKAQAGERAGQGSGAGRHADTAKDGVPPSGS